MHSDVAALLAVQDDDVAIHELESNLAELAPRLEAMAAERTKAAAALEQAKQLATSEEKRRQDVAARVAQHKTLQEKHQAALDSVSSMREATAATAQLDAARRMIEEDERELSSIGHRLTDANALAEEREGIVTSLDNAQSAARSSLASDQQRIEKQLAESRRVREDKAKKVPRALLTRYERIRSRKRVHAVFALRGNSCGNCDTALPLQRRSIMAATGATEICEGCGVMLYASE